MEHPNSDYNEPLRPLSVTEDHPSERLQTTNEAPKTKVKKPIATVERVDSISSKKIAAAEEAKESADLAEKSRIKEQEEEKAR